jgi:hypothetical protein
MLIGITVGPDRSRAYRQCVDAGNILNNLAHGCVNAPDPSRIRSRWEGGGLGLTRKAAQPPGAKRERAKQERAKRDEVARHVLLSDDGGTSWRLGNHGNDYFGDGISLYPPNPAPQSTHTHTHTHAHALKHTHTHQMHAHACVRLHARLKAHARAHKHAHAHAADRQHAHLRCVHAMQATSTRTRTKLWSCATAPSSSMRAPSPILAA